MLLYAIFAQDLARERSRDLERAATRHRLAAPPPAGTTPALPGRLRTLVARPLRTFNGGTQPGADAACTVATRLEGRSA